MDGYGTAIEPLDRRAPRLGGDNGAVLVEAAFIMPVFLVLALGIFEGSGIVRHWLAVSNAASSGARTLAVRGNDPLADYQALVNIRRDLTAISLNNVQRIVVFKPTMQANGLPSTTPQCTTGGSVTNLCNVYTVADLSLVPSTPNTAYFGRCVTPPLSVRDCYWAPNTRKVAVAGTNGPPDYLGLYIQARYTYASKMFGNTKDVSQTVVTRIEPQDLN